MALMGRDVGELADEKAEVGALLVAEFLALVRSALKGK